MDNVSILIKILSIKGVGPATAKKLIPTSYISCDSDLKNFLQRKSGMQSQLRLTPSLIRLGIEKGNQIIAESRKHNISFLDFNSPLYPTLLKTIENPPMILSYMGDIMEFYQRVGSLYPSIP